MISVKERILSIKIIDKMTRLNVKERDYAGVHSCKLLSKKNKELQNKKERSEW